MEAPNNITEQMKEAARNAESKPFAGMDSVWDKISAKLDADEAPQKEPIVVPFFNYKKIAAAAAVLILIGFGTGYFFTKKNDDLSVAIQNTKHEIKVPVASTEDTTTSTTALIDNPSPTTQNNSKQIDHPLKSINTHGIKNKIPGSKNKAASSKPVMVANVKNIQGRVLDEQGEPAIGATVKLKGTNIGTQTDLDGNYSFSITKDQPVVEISYLGSKTEEIVVADNFNLGTTKLAADGNVLQSVEISTPYGPPVTRESYVGSADVITVRKIEHKPLSNLWGALKGKKGSNQGDASQKQKAAANSYSTNYAPPASSQKYGNARYNAKGSDALSVASVADITKAIEGGAPGVQVTNGSGQPGSGAAIQIRGRGFLSASEAPLIVVDGAPYDGDINSINPKDVASMNILKDAMATSLYGSRGANGVIVITTKHALPKKKKWSIKNWFRKSKPTSFIAPQASAPVAVAAPADEDYDSFEENPFENPSQTPLSTFSIDVDNAAYSNIRRFINAGQRVPKDAVRVEEMINYFHYQYPQPKNADPFSINTEYSNAPWNEKHKLLRIGLQGKIIDADKLPASNLVFLIDVSGSMSDANKLPLLKLSLKLLVSKLRKEDRVAIVVYAGNAGLVLPSTSGADKDVIIGALDRLEAGGSTAGGQGIELAYKIAQENFMKNGNNRVILATDGDFNVGASSNQDMQTLIEEKRKSNIFLTCLGYGMGNYKDSKMEILADKGNGNYAYIDNLQEANKFLVKEFSGTMYSIARDVKIQIEFNPAYVQAYRLIGYENRKLKDEDFANDAIDAGELGSGHTVTALYEIIPQGVKSEFSKMLPDLKYSNTATNKIMGDELATIKFRYKKPTEDKSIEMVHVVNHQPLDMNMVSKDYRMAASVAWFGLQLRGSKLIANKDRGDILKLAKGGVDNDEDGYKSEFVRLIETAQ
jgi:Ca-activated chloride channel family protein